MNETRQIHPNEALLRVTDLSKHFRVRNGLFRSAGPRLAAVDRVSLEIGEGRIFGLAGESGSGKSTLGRIMVQLLRADSGEMLFRGRKIDTLTKNGLHDLRRRIQIIFQDPAAALSPRRRIRQTLLEPLNLFGIGAPDERESLAVGALEAVGLDSKALPRFPHQFSSGQRQRIGIARALLTGPELVIADEAVSALDVSVQAQILELILQLRQERGIAFLFISHDLAVIRQVADDVGIMFRGQLVESAPCAELFANPLHPYTRQLLASIPSPDPDHPEATFEATTGLVREPAPRGCVYANRCDESMPHCPVEAPRDLRPDPQVPHRVKCHLHEQGK